jgi:hypothetical protein
LDYLPLEFRLPTFDRSRRGQWIIIQTRGKRFFVVEPRPSTYSIFDTPWPQRITAAFDALPMRCC